MFWRGKDNFFFFPKEGINCELKKMQETKGDIALRTLSKQIKEKLYPVLQNAIKRVYPRRPRTHWFMSFQIFKWNKNYAFIGWASYIAGLNLCDLSIDMAIACFFLFVEYSWKTLPHY